MENKPRERNEAPLKWRNEVGGRAKEREKRENGEPQSREETRASASWKKWNGVLFIEYRDDEVADLGRWKGVAN